MPPESAPETTPARPTALKRLLLRVALVLPAAALLALVFAGSVPNRSSAAPEASNLTALDLKPTDRHRRVARLVGEVIERSHYRQAQADDQLSSLVFDRYLESLDGNRSYFTAGDIAEFEHYRTQLDDAISTGNVEPAFVIFQRLQERNRTLLKYALALLDTEPDFKLDESFEFDRSKATWPANEAELKELWRKRVKNDGLSLLLTGKTWKEAADVLRKRYERVLKRTEQVSADDVFENFMNAYAHVFDPHSNYLSPRSSEEYSIAMKLSYEGIGASLQLVDDYVTIMNILPGGPAAIAGTLKANDRITAVAQGANGDMVDVVGWRLDDVVQLIRGPVNTIVRLSILPAGAIPGSKETQLVYTRNKISLEGQAARKEVKVLKRGDQELRVGVVTVPSFYQDFDARVAGDKDYRSTTRDVARLIGELKKEKVDTVLIDLRGNGGGHLTEATGLVGLFIPEGPVVQLRETGGRVEVLDDPEPGVVWDGPLAVLVDRTSASASEIFAAAIQDYGRGVILGQETYGKGTVQNLYTLDRWALGPNAGFGQLTVTIGKYYRITGDSVQNRGVIPDIAMPSLINTEDVGESSRESALPWDRIKGVTFTNEPGLSATFPLLAKNFATRAATDPDIKALEGDVGAFEKLRAEKVVSLNLEKRRAERKQADDERLQRENARRAAHQEAPLKSLEELAAADEPDALLDEASQLAADLVTLKTVQTARVTRN